MNQPCPVKAPCQDDSNPVQNLSAEAPDFITFYSYGSAPGSILPGRSTGPGSPGPGPGQNWSPSCETPNGPATCIAHTQAEADLCIQRLAQLCQPDPTDPAPTGPTDPSGNPAFFNTLQSCTVTCPDGSPFTFQVAAGLFVANSLTSANRQAHSYACNQANLFKLCFSPLTPTGACTGTVYTGSTTITGAAIASVTITAGALPPGVTLSQDGNTINLTGTPTESGNFTFTIKVTNGRGDFMSKTFTISVISITTTSPLPSYIPATPYTQALQATGGTSPLTWTLINDTELPTGLTLSSAGVITGSTSVPGTTSFTVQVQDAGGIKCTKDFTIAAVSTLLSICDYATVLAALTVPVCAAGVDPAWDGTFSLLTTGSTGLPMYYILNKTVNGREVGVEQNPTYPSNPVWKDQPFSVTTICFSNTGFWVLTIACPGSILWQGEILFSVAGNPVGEYVRSGGTSPGPASINVTSPSKTCCPPAWGSIVWGAPVISTRNAGTAQFDDFGGGGGDVICDAPNGDLGDDYGAVTVVGTLRWIGGSGCNTNVEIDIFKTATPAALTGSTFSGILIIFTPDVGTIQVVLDQGFGTIPPGPQTYNFQFNPAGFASGPGTLTITVKGQAPTGAPGSPQTVPGHQAIEMDFQFTNL